MTETSSRVNKRISVLVVEDAPVHQMLLQENLRDLDPDFTVAEDGVQALRALEGELPDLIILDLAMPKMDGFQFLWNLKSDPRTSGIPVLVVTAHGQSGTAKEVADLGADVYLEKPVWRQDFVKIASDLLGLETPGE